jgi:hypothetical protein
VPPIPPGVVKYYDEMARITNVRRHAQHDLAVADVPGVTYFEHFSLCTSGPPTQARLLTYDLVSRITFDSGAGNRMTITPYFWTGYVHAVLDVQEPGMQAPAFRACQRGCCSLHRP